MSPELPGITGANEDHTENSPSKRKAAIDEPEGTPCRTAPNSARKRRPEHALARATPTPSHGVKMLGIFQDAAVSLEACYTSPNASSSNMKKLRLPIRQARKGPFGYTGGQDRVAPPQAANSPKLDSPTASGVSRPLTTPAMPYGPEFPSPLPIRLSSWDCQNTLSSSDQAKESVGGSRARQIIVDYRKDLCTDNVTYPKLNQRKMRGFSSVPSSLSSDCHSSHGVPVVIPIPTKSHDRVEVIDSWLSEIHEPGPAESPDGKPDTPQSTDQKPYTPQSPGYSSWSPQSPDWKRDMPQSPFTNLQQQDSTSKPNIINSPPKRPFTSFCSLSNPLVALPKHAEAGTPISASSSCKENTHSIYPILPYTTTIPPSIRHSTPSPPPNYSSLSPQSLCPFPMCTPFVPSAASGPPTPHPSPVSSLGSCMPSNTGNPRRKRRRVRSPSEVPLFARSFRLLTGQINSSNEEDAPVKELSPHVERYRKGYGPQPERRPSYWDSDILSARANGQGEGSDGDDEATMEKFSGERAISG